MRPSLIKPFLFGLLATSMLLGIYFGIVTIISGWKFTLQQFDQYWYFVVSLALGFGIQIGLYTYLKRLQRASRGVVAVSGTTTTVAMLSCCSHYVANLIPILGIAGALTIIGQYQIEFFWFGIIANLLGIIYMLGKIKKVGAIALPILFLLFFFASPLHAAEELGEFRRVTPDYPPDTFAKAEIIRILNDTDADYLPASSLVQEIRIRILNSEEKGKEVTAQNSILSNTPDGFKLKEGDRIVVLKNVGPNGARYYATDLYRIPPLLIILALFIALVIYFGRLKGFMSVVGLAFSIFVIAKFIVPNILAGKDPFIISLTGALLIVTVAIYLAHGFTRRTTIAYVSTLVTLGIATILSALFVSVGKLLGTGSETALYLQLGADAVNLRGLLLGGIIIGTLGVLDDITTAQSAVVDELKKANPAFDLKDLYHRGLSVGKEHIAALVNTLALAYAGAALPLFLLFSLNTTFPLWVTINGQDIAEEVIRTLVGSMALILAVPITTFFAAVYFSRTKRRS